MRGLAMYWFKYSYDHKLMHILEIGCKIHGSCQLLDRHILTRAWIVCRVTWTESHRNCMPSRYSRRTFCEADAPRSNKSAGCRIRYAKHICIASRCDVNIRLHTGPVHL
jgi:hypothetical protein